MFPAEDIFIKVVKGVGCKLVNNINYSSRIFPDHISLGQNSKRDYTIDCSDKGNNLKP